MKEFSELNRKCLTNMPALLDMMATTMEELEQLLSPIYDDMKDFLEENLPSKFQLTNKWERGTVYLFNERYKYYYLSDLYPYANIKYKLPIEQTTKRNPLKFEVEFGYMCDDGQITDIKQNEIYFQLYDNSESGFLNSDILDELKQHIPATWKTGNTEDCSSIWISLNLDETLAVEKISQLAEDFKQYVLLPVLDKLKK